MEEQLNEFIRRVKVKTPVDTGHLRDSWVVEKIQIRDDEILGWFRNDADYASHVEWGHATPYNSVNVWGLDVRDIGLNFDLSSAFDFSGDPNWVAGRFMMRRTVTELESEMPRKLEASFKRFLAGG